MLFLCKCYFREVHGNHHSNNSFIIDFVECQSSQIHIPPPQVIVIRQTSLDTVPPTLVLSPSSAAGTYLLLSTPILSWTNSHLPHPNSTQDIHDDTLRSRAEDGPLPLHIVIVSVSDMF